jgi:hypothetical protein
MDTILGIVAMMGYYQALGGMAGVPIAVPPAETPVAVYAAAPEDCLFYMFSSGAGECDPNSPNASEQFLAEPEIQDFTAAVYGIVESVVNSIDDESEEGVALYVEGITSLLTQPWFVCLEEAPPLTDESSDVTFKAIGGFRIEESLFNRSLALILEESDEEIASEERDVDGITVRSFPSDDIELALDFAYVDGWLLVSSGENAMEELLERLDRPEPQSTMPEWLSRSLASVEILRRSTFFYVNAAKAQNLIGEAIESDLLDDLSLEDFQAIQKALGIENLQAVCSTSGFDEKQYAEMTALDFNGPPSGLLGVLAGGSLAPEDLNVVPADANLALAYNVDMKELLDTLMAFLDSTKQNSFDFVIPAVPAYSVDPVRRSNELDDESDDEPVEIEIKPSDVLDSYCGMMEMQFGVHPVDDLLPLLGDSIVYYNSPSEGGHLFTGSTLVFEILDEEQFLELQSTLIEGLCETYPDYMNNALTTIDASGVEMNMLRLGESGEVAFYPTWAVADGRLFVSLFPGNIRGVLSRQEDFQSLADSEAITPMLSGDAPPCGIVYQDFREFIKAVYPLATVYGSMAASEFEEEYGFRLPVEYIPSMSVISRHAQPQLRSVRTDGDRIVFQSSKVYPGGVKDLIAGYGAMTGIIAAGGYQHLMLEAQREEEEPSDLPDEISESTDPALNLPPQPDYGNPYAVNPSQAPAIEYPGYATGEAPSYPAANPYEASPIPPSFAAEEYSSPAPSPYGYAPSPSSGYGYAPSQCKILISSQGEIVIGAENFEDIDELTTHLKSLQESGVNDVVILGDQECEFSRVVEVISACREAGIMNYQMSMVSIELDPSP